MGELSLFYLLHTKITMNIIEMVVQINDRGFRLTGFGLTRVHCI